MLTTRAKELVAIIYTIGNFPQNMEGVYEGLVREKLLPGLESLSRLNWDAIVEEIKSYTERHGMFKNQKQTGSSHLANGNTQTNFKK